MVFVLLISFSFGHTFHSSAWEAVVIPSLLSLFLPLFHLLPNKVYPTSQQLSICTYYPGGGRKIFVILTLKVAVELAILDVVR